MPKSRKIKRTEGNRLLWSVNSRKKRRIKRYSEECKAEGKVIGEFRWIAGGFPIHPRHGRQKEKEEMIYCAFLESYWWLRDQLLNIALILLSKVWSSKLSILMAWKYSFGSK